MQVCCNGSRSKVGQLFSRCCRPSSGVAVGFKPKWLGFASIWKSRELNCVVLVLQQANNSGLFENFGLLARQNIIAFFWHWSDTWNSEFHFSFSRLLMNSFAYLIALHTIDRWCRTRLASIALYKILVYPVIMIWRIDEGLIRKD